ncbi:hypothetical protein C8R45DRAFT_1113805 [Mycena sanguinolenta]|nr:hypothetical protein C8R45DRAFT_1113805 [Mycena sanguinolenta]
MREKLESWDLWEEERKAHLSPHATLSRASNIRKERIADIVAHVKALETEPADGADRFLDDAMFKAILTRHKYAAIDAAVLNEWYFFDPTMADASCEMRPPLHLVMDNDLQAILKPGDQDLARAHREAHAKDKTDTQARNVQQALGALLDPAHQDLVTRIETALGEEAVMDVAGENALESGDTRDLIKLEQVFRSILAVDAVELFKDMVDTIPPHETAPENAPRYFIENQLSAAMRRIQSRIPYTVECAGQSEEEHIPLLPIFNQILAILYLQYNQRRNIVIRVKRKELRPLPRSPDDKQRYSEKHAGTYTVMFEPDEKTGLFCPVAYRNKACDKGTLSLLMGPLSPFLCMRTTCVGRWSRCDLQVDHIYTASSDWLDDDTAAFTEKHNSAPNTSFGPFVVRIGDTAATCTTYEDAKQIIGAGKPNKRWALYKKMYPNNASFAK